MNHTIAAIATPQAAGGIGVIRISGPGAIEIADAVFDAASGQTLTESKGYRAHFGRVFNEDGPIDEAIALVFRAPHSYTGEDVVEFSCHGGLFLLQQTLRAVFHAGAIPASAGEFTRRAFLNGKMDLTQAESVMGLIAAQGGQAARAALSAHDGALSREIKGISQSLLRDAAHMAAWADYPEEELPELDMAALTQDFTGARQKLAALLSRFDTGRAVIQGVDTVIAGRPNVGKSTLMNLLTGGDRSIVTSQAGTTRDIVEETVRLGDLVLHLADTAGLRETDDPVERIGVSRARERLERAQLILAVFDASEPLDEEDFRLLEACQNRPCIAIINKSDLTQRLDARQVEAAVAQTVFLSAAQGEGYGALCEAATRVLGTQDFDPAAPLLATERQRDCCRQALDGLDQALEAIQMGMTLDAVTVCIDSALSALLELTGEKANEAIVDEVFSTFCVGK